MTSYEYLTFFCATGLVKKSALYLAAVKLYEKVSPLQGSIGRNVLKEWLKTPPQGRVEEEVQAIYLSAMRRGGLVDTVYNWRQMPDATKTDTFGRLLYGLAAERAIYRTRPVKEALVGYYGYKAILTSKKPMSAQDIAENLFRKKLLGYTAVPAASAYTTHLNTLLRLAAIEKGRLVDKIIYRPCTGAYVGDPLQSPTGDFEFTELRVAQMQEMNEPVLMQMAERARMMAMFAGADYGEICRQTAMQPETTTEQVLEEQLSESYE